MSQFAFLMPEFAEVHEHAARAESLAHADPRGACFYARLALETAVTWLYRREASLRNPYETSLSARIHEPSFQALLGPALVAKARIVKDLGNRAAHEARSPLAFPQAATALRELFHLGFWLARTYGRGAKPDATIAFSTESLPRNASVPAQSLAQLQAIARRFTEAVKARDEAEAGRRASEEERGRLEAELAALRAEVAAAKAANAQLPDTHDYDEAATRDSFVDLLLAEAGWRLTRPGHDTEFPVAGMPNASGRGFVDYVLWGDDGRPLGLVEAKRTAKDPRAGQRQAELYADALEARFGQRPVIFCTNGYEHWLWDDRRYPPRRVQGFLAKDELELAVRRRTQLQPLSATEINRAVAERFYQTRAIRRVAEAFEKDGSRRALLVMATGAGKTRTVIALADLLMRAGWARRVLFLADRVALVNQAVGAFKRHLPSASPVNLVTEKDAAGRVYVSTYPTMMRLIDETKEGVRRFGPGHFDLIVIDEAHRSVYRKYGAIFDYFDSLLVGLTATPKNEVDRDTYRLFDLDRGVPTDSYGLDEAVRDGFLVPPKAVSLTTDFLDLGIDYARLSEEEKDAWDAAEWDEDGAVPARVEPAAINKWLFNKDTVDKVLEHLTANGVRVADGDRLAKTIVFAKNQDHARFVVERFDANYPHLAGSFARVIISSDPYAQSLIDDFGQAEKAPHVAVSVDMLDTGIDVPEVANLVFFKVVRSKAKFWQMIGRGTRLKADLFGPGRHKAFFAVFDWCRNFEFFNQNPELAEGSVGESLAARLFAARVELIHVLDELRPSGASEGAPHDYAQSSTPVLHAGEPGSAPDAEAELEALRAALVARLREELAGMSVENFLVRPKRRLVEAYAREDAWKRLDLDRRAELAELAGLPSSLTDDDVAAKQFDLLVLRAQLALLRTDASFSGLRRKVVETASLLEELTNIPMVAKEHLLILDLQTDEFWADVTAPMLDAVRRRLRDLVKLIEPKRRQVVVTDFEDRIGAETGVEVRGIGTGTDMERFRVKARHFLKAHENHIAVLKLRRNQPLTPIDLAELERLFVEAGGTEPEDLARIKADEGLGLFVRSLVGLDREAAKAAFNGFEAGRRLSANQIEFLNLVIDHLTHRGTMDPGLLYESPFTDFDPMGLEGLFEGGDAAAVVDVLREIERRAAA